ELSLEKVDQTAVGPHRMLTEEKGVRAGAGVVALVSLALTVPHELCVCEEPEPCRSRTNSRFARIATCMLCEAHGRPHSTADRCCRTLAGTRRPDRARSRHQDHRGGGFRPRPSAGNWG